MRHPRALAMEHWWPRAWIRLVPSTAGAVWGSVCVCGGGTQAKLLAEHLLAQRGQARGGRPALVLANEGQRQCGAGRASGGARAAAGTDGAGSAVGDAASAS